MKSMIMGTSDKGVAWRTRAVALGLVVLLAWPAWNAYAQTTTPAQTDATAQVPAAGQAAGTSAPAVTTVGPPSVAPIAERLLDAVVNISTTQTLKGPEGVPLPKVPEGSPFEEFFKDFFDKQQIPNDQRRVSSLGSGFVIDPSGIIVTNNHVIADADEIIINFNDGSKLKVDKVLGRDTKTDLAVLQVKPVKPLAAVKFGDSSVMHVGDWVMAIGNPFGLGGSVTVGIISAKKRDINSGPYDEFLQTDAAINKGNSGGPLFNMAGDVIGINTAIISPSGGSIGIGFAVPANTAGNVIEQLRQFGETRRGWIGVSIQSITDDIADSLGLNQPKGALVGAVTPGGPAEKAGLKTGDVILQFDGQDVESMRTLPKIVALTPVGKAVQVVVLRKGKNETLTVTVERLVETEPDKGQGQGGTDQTDPGSGTGAKQVLGLTLTAVTPELRKKYNIADSVDGVVITDVDSTSGAADKGLKPGDVIVEVTNEKVASPEDFAKRIEAVKTTGRKSVLLLVSDPKGEIRFVAVPLDNG